MRGNGDRSGRWRGEGGGQEEALADEVVVRGGGALVVGVGTLFEGRGDRKWTQGYNWT